MKPMQRTSRGMLFGLAVAACACGEAGVRPPPDAAAPADAEGPLR
jgi:hypothetical protein